MGAAKDNAKGHSASARVVLAMAAACLGLIGGGCATTASEDRPAPTHRWISKTVESQAQYQHDNKACAVVSGDETVASDSDGLRRDAPAFVVYERCMGERGYELATY